MIGSVGEGLFRGRPVEKLIFGMEDEVEIGSVIQRFCRAMLGVGVRNVLFRRTSVGVVFGIELEDSRQVVLKAHQPRQREDFLRAVFDIQTHLARSGFPCPRPVAPPAPIGNGFATVEELVDDGLLADAHRPIIRKAIASSLARLIELTEPIEAPAALRGTWSLWETSDLWPSTAHSPIFDFAATTVGAEWIDELAWEAKAALPKGGDERVVHSDWSGKHFRFDDRGEVTVVYDWDSLALRTEAQALGIAAATFTSNFELEVTYAPEPSEVSAFIDEYSAARTTSVPADERRASQAVAAYVMAYSARCEHALGLRGDFTKALGRFGRSYLSDPRPRDGWSS